MVSVEQVREMKELGIIQRKDQEHGQDTEFVFKLKCCKCGEEIDTCFCTETFEEAKEVIEKEKTWLCGACHMTWKILKRERPLIAHAVRERMESYGYSMKDRSALDMTIEEILVDSYETDGEHYVGDTSYFECECPVQYEEEDVESNE